MEVEIIYIHVIDRVLYQGHQYCVAEAGGFNELISQILSG